MIISDATASRVRRSARQILPWLLVVAILGNLGITAQFQSGTSHSIRFSDSSDLADLVNSTYPEMRQEYAVYAELARIAQGSTLTLPDGHPFDPDRLRFLAGVKRVPGGWFPDDLAGRLTPVVSGEMVVDDDLIAYSLVAGNAGEPYGAIRSYGLILVAPIRVLESVGSEQ